MTRRTEFPKIETAPLSSPLAQVWFLAYCPDDDWAPLGNWHLACRYPHADPGMVKVHGSNNDRRATHWCDRPDVPSDG